MILINEIMGMKWHALGYELLCLWLQSGIPLVTKQFGYKTVWLQNVKKPSVLNLS